MTSLSEENSAMPQFPAKMATCTVALGRLQCFLPESERMSLTNMSIRCHIFKADSCNCSAHFSSRSLPQPDDRACYDRICILRTAAPPTARGMAADGSKTLGIVRWKVLGLHRLLLGLLLFRLAFLQPPLVRSVGC